MLVDIDGKFVAAPLVEGSVSKRMLVLPMPTPSKLEIPKLTPFIIRVFGRRVGKSSRASFRQVASVFSSSNTATAKAAATKVE